MVREREIPREENKDEIIPKEYMLKIVKTYAQKHFFLNIHMLQTQIWLGEFN